MTTILAPSLTISPAIIEEVVDSQNPLVKELVLTNNATFPLPIKVSLASYGDENPTHPLSSLKTWIKADPTDLILQPQTSETIKLTLAPPPTLEPGGHYATLLFQPLIPVSAINAESSQTINRVGTLLFLVAKGDITENVDLNSIEIPSWQFSNELKVIYHLKNTGTIHSIINGNYSLTNIFDQPIVTGNFESETILPQQSLDLTRSLHSHLLIGPLKLHSNITFGAGHNVIKISDKSVYFFPIQTILLLSFCLTSFIWFVIVGHKRIKLAWNALIGK